MSTPKGEYFSGYLAVVTEKDLGPEKLGARIRRIAKEKGVPMKTIAEAAGLSGGAIAKLGSGDRGSTSFERGLKIARALKVDPWTLAFPGEPAMLRVVGTESHYATQVDLDALKIEVARLRLAIEGATEEVVQEPGQADQVPPGKLRVLDGRRPSDSPKDRKKGQ